MLENLPAAERVPAVGARVAPEGAEVQVARVDLAVRGLVQDLEAVAGVVGVPALVAARALAGVQDLAVAADWEAAPAVGRAAAVVEKERDRVEKVAEGEV